MFPVYRSQHLRGAQGLGAGNSQDGFVSLSGNFLLCSDVKGVGESPLGITHSRRFKGDADISILVSASLSLTWSISPEVPPRPAAGAAKRRLGSSVSPPRAAGPALGAANEPAAPFLRPGPGPLLSGTLVSKTSQAVQVVCVAPQLVFLTDPTSAHYCSSMPPA